MAFIFGHTRYIQWNITTQVDVGGDAAELASSQYQDEKWKPSF
jgi:hypothetical protein